MKIMAWIAALLLSVQLFAVNLNTATKEELMSIKGIGVKTAEKIINYREEAKFQTIDEIKNIKGIGEKKFEKMKEQLEV